MKLYDRNLGKYFLLIYTILFLYFSGIFENLNGNFPECIGVCNNPNINNPILLFGISLLFLILILVHDKLFIYLNINNLNKNIFYISITTIIILLFYITSWDMDSDDKWLGYRISKNVIEHGLHYWNPRELINISTSTVWPYVASLAHLAVEYLGIKWELAIKLLGLSIYALIGIYIYKMKINSNTVKMFIFTGVISYFPLVYWSISGLETVLACLLIIIIINNVYMYGFTPKTWVLYGSIIFIRPEFIIAPAVSILINILFNKNKKYFARFIIPSLSLGIVTLLWVLINYFIWGDPFPTPFYLKSLFHSPFTDSLTWYFKGTNALIHLVSSFLQSTFLLFGICLLFYVSFNLIFRWKSNLINNEVMIRAVTLFIGFFAVAIYHVISGYMHMSYVFRYFLPVNIAFIVLSGLVLYIMQDQNKPNELIKKTTLFGFTLIQCLVFYISGTYSSNVELSLTRAKHRDAFSGEEYSLIMRGWRDIGNTLRSIEAPDDRIWVKDGTNLAGAALTNMYALDGYYSPLKMSKFDSIKNCSSIITCAQHFNYVMAREDDGDAKELLKDKKYTILIKEHGVVVYKNHERAY